MWLYLPSPVPRLQSLLPHARNRNLTAPATSSHANLLRGDAAVE